MKQLKFMFWFIIRIIITFLLLILILLCIDRLIGIRREKQFGWTWYSETSKINQILLQKYIDNDYELYPLVINRNETLQPKQKDEKRILVVGDSYVFGYAGDNKNYIWWKQLQRKIKEEGYSNISVYGAGTWDLNTQDELDKIINNDAIMKEIDPDLVIFSYVSNDAEPKNKDGSKIYPDSSDWNYNTSNAGSSVFVRNFNNIYKETRDRLFNITDNETILTLAAKVYGYKSNLKMKLISTGKSLKMHEQTLISVDKTMKEKNIPYFFYFCDNNTHWQPQKNYNKNVEKVMKKNNINYYNSTNKANYYYDNFLMINNLNNENLRINPADTHPGTIKTNFYSDDVLSYLHNDYSYIFDEKTNNFKSNININDTMPLLNITKEDDYNYVIEYPKKENKLTENSNFLYLPIKKNYIKLNLEYPIKVNKVKITGSNLKNVDLYVNLVNEKVGFDLDNATQKLTKIENDNNIFNVNKKITSLNISANFLEETDRNLRVEFIK